ncbi:nucleotide exchange factor GrpE [Terasakiispira papahanaumokuakeensis]|uniref:Protein GrpE n=1 Tax=Terasakiispira papahanaumokuakeensis TaxID=197479 RepID=A0A1E2VD46_9GAMM|nr:nucleotide exchange factor GrpE [Terasakiispira papahanaumokuakeensis]ODC04901.1 nucleotide exchange factor GrpE [Terasakiispira papahanaumokuakeensis]
MSQDEQLQQTAAETAAEQSAPQAEQTSADNEALVAQVESLEQALSEAKEQSLRAAAEAQNIRRRSEQDVEKAHKFALEKFARELLPVVDSLEKAVDALGEVSDAQREGVEMTFKLLMDSLQKFNIEQVDPRNETFDPQLHEAMTMVPNPDLPNNTVMDVLQKGFTLNGRLLRPAMVVVSTGGAAKKIDEKA